MRTLKHFIERELTKIEPLWTAEGKGSYWWGVRIGLETVLAKLCEMDGTVMANAPQPERRQYDPHGSLSEYGIFPECDAAPAAQPAASAEPLTDTYVQTVPDKCDRIVWRGSYYHLPLQAVAQEQPPADDEVVFYDGVGAWRSSVKSCRDGVQWIKVGDRIYWPLSDSDAKRLQSACCGNGSFDGPTSPAGEGEEVMVNTPYGVFTLPLQPSELSSGPRFVVHVPSPEAPAVKTLVEALETCLETEERPEVIELAKTALAAASQLARDGCHCGTCTCDPNMTPAVRYDLSPAQHEEVIRDHLIRLGRTPPGEHAQQPAAPSETINVVGMPEFDSLLDHIYEHGTAAEGVIEKANAFAQAVRNHLIRQGWTPPNEQAMSQPAAPSAEQTTGITATELGYALKRATPAQVIEYLEDDVNMHVALSIYFEEQQAKAMVERIAALLYEEATGDPWTVAGVEHPEPDRDYYRGLARKIAALVTTYQEPKP